MFCQFFVFKRVSSFAHRGRKQREFKNSPKAKKNFKSIFVWSPSESKNEYISPDKLFNKAVVFYRDDCSDCRKIYPSLYIHNIVHHDIVFVNMNNMKNKKYIEKYNLKEVPTIIKDKKSYVGTNRKRIQMLLTNGGDDRWLIKSQTVF